MHEHCNNSLMFRLTQISAQNFFCSTQLQSTIQSSSVMAKKKGKKPARAVEQLKKMFKQNKIRECKIELVRLGIGMYFCLVEFNWMK